MSRVIVDITVCAGVGSRGVEHLPGSLRDEFVEAGDHAGREARADQLTDARVRGRIARENGVTLVLGRSRSERETFERAVGAPVTADRLDFGMAEHDPEPDASGDRVVGTVG
jgi:hypothetical protein